MAAPVSEDTWAERDTTPEQISAALRGLLRERHAANHALVPARVLNLVVIVDRDWKGEIANRLDRVGRYHASRTILCAVGDASTTIDARAVMISDEPDAAGVGVMREQIEMDIGREHLERLDTVIDPVLVAELPTVVWAPHGHWQAVGSVLPLTDVVLLDSDDDDEFDGPTAALERAAELRRHAYVVDLAWLRTTPWRERLAAAFDPPRRRRLLSALDEIGVRYSSASTVSALLLAGWLASRLHWEPAPLEPTSGRLRAVAHRDGDGMSPIELQFEPVDQGVPGIAGVTVTNRDEGFALSLDRAPGGLVATGRFDDGQVREWQVLGASRGEGGILGEGVRQALLRDPTYEPALAAASQFNV